MTGTPTEDTVRTAWQRAWNEGRTEDMLSLLAPGYTRMSAEDSRGQDGEEFCASIVGVRQAFPDLHTEILDLIRTEDRLAVRWRSTGTHTGTMMGVPPTGRTVTVGGATFSTFEDGLITTENVTWDPRALLRALGIIHIGHDA